MICIYPADCTDFSTNGDGVLLPQSCTVIETLNGEYELTLVHPIDEHGKWRRLIEGCILRAPVPAAMTPRVQQKAQTQTGGTDIYRITGGRVNLRSGPGTGYRVLKVYKKGTEVLLQEKANASWYEIVCPDGKRGFMSTKYLSFVRSESNVQTAVAEIVESRQLRDQPFRIYRVVPELNQVTVYARHIFYDLLDNMVKSLKESKEQAKIIRNAARYLTGEAREGSIVTTSNDNRRSYDNSVTSTIQVQQMVVRDEQDIRSLAVEIATLTRRQQRGKGMRMA